MRILFLDRATHLETVEDLTTRARGGMVSSLFALPNHLSRLGHNCTVLSDIGQEGKTEDGVKWINHINMAESYDFLVCNRGIGDGYPDIKARRRLLWTHDLPHNGFIEKPRLINAFSGTVFMSDYAEKVWRSFYRDIGRGFVIPNGVNKALFYPREKDLDYLIYASAPNRGLKRLPLIFDAIKTRTRPSIHMKAYTNMGAMHPNEIDSPDNGNGDGFELIYRTVRESEIDLYDPLPQDRFAEELGRAGMMILPTDYPEICSNVVLQAMASGTPIITTGRLGSAPEWIRHGKTGMLTQWHPVDYFVYQLEIVRNAVAILNDPAAHRKMIKNAAKTKTLEWNEVAAAWEKMFRKLY